MYHLWNLFSLWKLLIFLNKGSYLNGKYLFQMIAFKRASSLPCFVLLNDFVCFIVGCFSSASGNLDNRRRLKVLESTRGQLWSSMSCVTGSRHRMPKGKEDFCADFRTVIGCLAMCPWSLCLPVGCEERLELLCFSQLLTLVGSKPDWRDSDWSSVTSRAGDLMLGWHCGFPLEIPKQGGAFIPPSPGAGLTSGLLISRGVRRMGLCLLPLPGRAEAEQGQGALPGGASATVASKAWAWVLSQQLQ